MARTVRRAVALVSVVFLAVFALHAHALKSGRPALPPRDPSMPTLTVLTYNVNFAIAGDAETLDAVRDAHADLVLLQETNADWEAAIRHSLGAAYPYMNFVTHGGAGGLGVLSRQPFTTRAELPGRWFPAWIVEAQTPLGPVQVLDVHLRPPLTGFGPLKGYWSNRAFRECEIQGFALALAPNEPTIVAGDFNEHEARAVQWLEGRGYLDALPLFPTPQDTWHWPIGPFTAWGTLDHVMVEGGLAPVQAQVELRGHSDHFPVRVELQRAPAALR